MEKSNARKGKQLPLAVTLHHDWVCLIVDGTPGLFSYLFENEQENWSMSFYSKDYGVLGVFRNDIEHEPKILFVSGGDLVDVLQQFDKMVLNDSWKADEKAAAKLKKSSK